MPPADWKSFNQSCNFLIVALTFSSGTDCFNLHHNSTEGVPPLRQSGRHQSPGLGFRMELLDGVETRRSAESADREYLGRSTQVGCCQVEERPWRFHVVASGNRPRCQVENFGTFEVGGSTATSCNHHLVVGGQRATWLVPLLGPQPRPLVGLLPP